MRKNTNTFFAGNPPDGEVILALETGIRGGSISLFVRGEEIDFWIGSGAVSRSEDILDETNKLLLKNGASKKDVGRVVFSRGPGSFTGLRIGAAIAKGLSKSTGCRLSACAVLEAMTIDETENVVAAVPFGGRQVCRRFFYGVSEDDLPGKTDTYISELELFTKHLSRSTSNLIFKKLILHEYLYEKFAETELPEFLTGAEKNISVINVGANLARFIAEKTFRDERLSDSVNSTDLIYPANIGNRNS